MPQEKCEAGEAQITAVDHLIWPTGKMRTLEDEKEEDRADVWLGAIKDLA